MNNKKMTDFGIDEYLPINQIFVKGGKAIILEKITKKMITVHFGYKNDKYKKIHLYIGKSHKKKVFQCTTHAHGQPDDGIPKFYIKMSPCSKLYLNGFEPPDDDYEIN